MTPILVASLLALAVLAWTLWPLGRPRRDLPPPADPGGEDDASLGAARERIYAALADLEYERRTGKIPDPAYDERREHLLEQAVHLLAREQAEATRPTGADPSGVVGPTPHPERLGQELEDEVAVMARLLTAAGGPETLGTDPLAGFCRRCGAEVVTSSGDCPDCGAPAAGAIPGVTGGDSRAV